MPGPSRLRARAAVALLVSTGCGATRVRRPAPQAPANADLKASPAQARWWARPWLGTFHPIDLNERCQKFTGACAYEYLFGNWSQCANRCHADPRCEAFSLEVGFGPGDPKNCLMVMDTPGESVPCFLEGALDYRAQLGDDMICNIHTQRTVTTTTWTTTATTRTVTHTTRTTMTRTTRSRTSTTRTTKTTSTSTRTTITTTYTGSSTTTTTTLSSTTMTSTTTITITGSTTTSTLSTITLSTTTLTLTTISTSTATQTTNTTTSTTSTTANATANGDPHLVNFRGEHFDVRRPGRHEFLVVPRRGAGQDRQLYVKALVSPVRGAGAGGTCAALYITGLLVSGGWLGSVGSLEFSTGTQKFDDPEAIGLRVNGTETSVPGFAGLVPPSTARLVRYHPRLPGNPKRHADTLVASLHLGPVGMQVGWAHTQQPLVNWLWLTFSGIESINVDIGGILGADEHQMVTKRPEWCEQRVQRGFLKR